MKKRLPDYAIFNINYRLSTGISNLFPLQENDVKAALQFIFSKIDLNSNEFTIKYFNPLILQNKLDIFQISGNQFIGFDSNLKIFEISTF